VAGRDRAAGRRLQQRLAVGQVRGQPFSGSVRGAGKLVQCLHAHSERGVYLSHAAARPNPGSTLLIFHGFAIQGADSGSSQFGPAMQACQHLLPHGTPSTAAELHQEFI
jgi:hypothetical protein